MIFKSIRKLYLNFTQIACNNKACKRERHFYILIILFIM